MLTVSRYNRRKIIIALHAILGAAATYCLHLLGTQKPVRVRRFKVRPINRNRAREGHFTTLVKDMREKEFDSEQFFKYSRMTPNMFDYLLSLVESKLKKDPTKNPLSPAHRLMMTLHYLAQGSSMQEIAWSYRVGKATVHVVIKETCQVLWDVLSPIELAPPTAEEWKSKEQGFFKRWNVPNCVGSIDGKHVIIQAPAHSGSDYFNYKKSYSLVLMAACDAFYRFTLVDIGAAGSNHDSTTFTCSNFGKALINDQLGFPEPKCLPGTSIEMEHFMAADSAFPLHRHIMRPFSGKYLEDWKNIFNYRISRARRTIENTFGILAQRWRILRRPIVASIEMCENIVKATVVLHNFVQKCEADIPVSQRKYVPTGFVDYEDPNGVLHMGNWRDGGSNSVLRSVNRVGSNNASRLFQCIRKTLANYFLSDAGSLPWQEEHVMRGALPTR